MTHCRSIAGDVSHLRNVQAACSRAEPLLNMTQLSGPEIVWWFWSAGRMVTPYLTFDWMICARSHGPVHSIPMWPLLNTLR